jgi:CRP-like cAMP-binding protein
MLALEDNATRDGVRSPAAPHRRIDKRPLNGGIIEDALRRTESAHLAAGVRAVPVRTAQVLVLDADPELADAVPAASLARARHALRANAYEYARGPILLDEPPEGTFGLLLVGGALTSETRLSASARMIELLLPGDILSPRGPSFTLPEHELRLTALRDGVRVVALDQRFVEAAAMWPELMTTIAQRLHDQVHRLSLHSAICQLARVEDRLIALLSHLAARIGKVTPHGVVIPLPLRHEDLAAYVGARRPSVSLAIKMLRAAGRLDRRADDTWVLPPADVPRDGAGF